MELGIHGPVHQELVLAGDMPLLGVVFKAEGREIPWAPTGPA